MRALLLSLILGLIWQNSLAELVPFTCDPVNDCSTIGVAGAVVPDPENCTNYYACINVNGEIRPSTTSIPCPDGEFFSITLRSCKFEETPGTCDSNDICTFTPTFCSSECPTEFGGIISVANRDNCSTYYVCLQSSPVLVSCPSNTPYFNGTVCVSDASQCCDFCTAYCKVAGSQIVDPCDCTSYYVCFDVGLALPNFKFACPSGTYYDETTATCKDGPCSNICPSCGTIDPTAPPTTTTLSVDTTTTTLSADTTTTTLSADTTTTTLSADTTTTTLPAESTTTTLSADTTTTTTPGNGCQSVESFTCPNDGNYAMCPFCNRDYFYCKNGVAAVGRCNGNTVFNPIPEYPYCLDPSNCPYP